MPRFIDPRGRATYGVGLCGRCGLKFSTDDLYDDPNYPGIKVCIKNHDMDDYDPYRLPPREPDQITLEFVRPDFPVVPTSLPPTVPEDPGWPPADSVSADGITFIPGT